jgi:hypothetical protein
MESGSPIATGMVPYLCAGIDQIVKNWPKDTPDYSKDKAPTEEIGFPCPHLALRIN